MKLYAYLSMAAMSVPALASQVGVIDSGTYFGHEYFKGQVWANPNETYNSVDDDNNGKVDDMVGWNFNDSNGQVFFPQHIAAINPDVYKIFEVLGRMDLGTVTEADKLFWKQKIQDLPADKKEQLVAHLNFYGQYAHSTHTSGIVAHGNPKAKIMSGRIFPDAEVPEYPSFVDAWAKAGNQENFIYDFIAKQSNTTFHDAAGYLYSTKMEVANYSIGIAMSDIAQKVLALMGNKTPTPEEIQTESQTAFESFEKEGITWLNSARSTLFVIAAGNNKTDNELLPIFPANISTDNAITVAASNGYSSLAVFSNWGVRTVHVAAPGVAIRSSVPGPTRSTTLPMSGTSMAAPFVSMVASQIKDINPALSPVEVKQILMETVDVKAWLQDKVVTSGIVNQARAQNAAQGSLTQPLYAAIASARTNVADMPETAPVQFNNADKTILDMQNMALRISQ